ncbi:hypothetical protein LP417_35545 (plasmid) [Polaromonas sp. P1-6]|nr:hypothetical protein LP417_35545 [Polaromonas sp. P1-6]
MNTFSMRAECPQDVERLTVLLTGASPISKLSTESVAPGVSDELIESLY